MTLRLALFFLLSGTVFAAMAQVPEKIHGKNKRLMPNAYYVEQVGLWRAEVAKEPRNAEAWYNCYRASRNAYIKGDEQENKDSRGTGRFVRLQGIVDSMAVRVPESFEFHHVRWMNGYGDAGLLPYLQRANAMAPQRPEPYLDLVAHYELTGEDSLRRATCAAYLKLSDYSPGLLNYGRNLLAGLAPNAILLTHGDKDTEAVWLLQCGPGLRTDVQLLNLDLLLRQDYRERQFQRLGIAPLAVDPLSSDAAFAEYQAHIIAHIAGNSANRPVEVSLSVEGPYTAGVQEALHVTGLSYRYSTAPFNNWLDLYANYYNHYDLDYLRAPYTPDISQGNVREFNAHYLPSLMALCEGLNRASAWDGEYRFREMVARVRRDAECEAEFQRSYGR
ncbi:MAG TPA: hypothetical protein VGE21_06130 [Flavobacteriales bacterium]